MRFRRIHTTLLAAGFGFLVAGYLGGAIGATAGWVATDARVGVRQTIGGFAVLLIVSAAIATAVESSTESTDLGSDYAAVREFAGLSARSAGILTAAMLIAAATQRRLTAPKREPDAAADVPTARLGMTWIPAAVAGVGSSLVRIVAGPPPMSPLYTEVSGQIESGIEFGRGGGFDAAATAIVVPVAPIVAALAPFGARSALVLVGGIAAALTVHLAASLGRRVIWATAGLAIVAPALWAQQLPATLATAAVATSILVLRDRSRIEAPVVVGGLALAVAALSRPEALLALPAVAAWLVVRGNRRRAISVVVVTLIALAPWQLWVQRNFETWWPTTAAGPVLAAASDGDARGGSQIGSLPALVLPAPEDEAMAHHKGLSAFRSRLLGHVRPDVVGARVLRAWDLWDPGNARAERNARELPFTGGAAAAYLQGFLSVIALIGAIGCRRRWRPLFPLFALPLAATLGAALSFGDRALVSWALPAVLVLAALAIVEVLPAIRLGRSTATAQDQPASAASAS